MPKRFDVIIVGSGTAGLSCALALSEQLSVAIISKKNLLEGCSFYAQGGISAVLDDQDSFNSHTQDTLDTACGLADRVAVDFMVSQAPAVIAELEKQGVCFTKENNSHHLTQEGGHSHRRVAHVADKTGSAIQNNLLKSVKQRSNITLFEQHLMLDLLISKQHCYGGFVLDTATGNISRFFANHTILATGGASKAYLYTSNPDTSTGDGLAMAHRAGCDLVDMEFTQFHPTCLYHHQAKSFLISEALRGEGAKLTLPNGENFMSKYDARAELAPRDIVAYAIDSEMKELGIDCVFLDISFKDKQWIIEHFPTIYAKCLSFGIDITKEAIPVVPSAHYTCGGIATDLQAKTHCNHLYAIGEVAHTGVHGANRLASNSLLECVVFARSCADFINQSQTTADKKTTFPAWNSDKANPPNERIIVKHLWDEVRRVMWNFVGIVRNTQRLQHAKKHLLVIEEEVNHYYHDYIISSDLIELRNLVAVSMVIVQASLDRKESIGLYFNSDYPNNPQKNVDRQDGSTFKNRQKHQ